MTKAASAADCVAVGGRALPVGAFAVSDRAYSWLDMPPRVAVLVAALGCPLGCMLPWFAVIVHALVAALAVPLVVCRLGCCHGGCPDRSPCALCPRCCNPRALSCMQPALYHTLYTHEWGHVLALVAVFVFWVHCAGSLSREMIPLPVTQCIQTFESYIMSYTGMWHVLVRVAYNACSPVSIMCAWHFGVVSHLFITLCIRTHPQISVHVFIVCICNVPSFVYALGCECSSGHVQSLTVYVHAWTCCPELLPWLLALVAALVACYLGCRHGSCPCCCPGCFPGCVFALAVVTAAALV